MPKLFLEAEDFPVTRGRLRDVKVYSELDNRRNYNALDKAAKRRGFSIVVGSGWVPTMEDPPFHTVDGALRQMNEIIEKGGAMGYDMIVGFSQTGNFSVGFTVYGKMH